MTNRAIVYNDLLRFIVGAEGLSREDSMELAASLRMESAVHAHRDDDKALALLLDKAADYVQEVSR